MRADMAKVVTERPRRGSGMRSRKFGGRVRLDQTNVLYGDPTESEVADWVDEQDFPQSGRVAWSRRRNGQGSDDYKEFSDLIGPLRRYLHKQVGRPWDDVWSELSRHLDKRSVSGSHIIDHVWMEVTRHCYLAEDGHVYEHTRRWRSLAPVSGLYVHPMTGRLCHAPEHWRRDRNPRLREFLARLGPFGVAVDRYGPSGRADAARYRVEGLRVWERRPAGWFVHDYRHVPTRESTRLNWKGEPVTYVKEAHLERHSTRQASRREIHAARDLLSRQPF